MKRVLILVLLLTCCSYSNKNGSAFNTILTSLYEDYSQTCSQYSDWYCSHYYKYLAQRSSEGDTKPSNVPQGLSKDTEQKLYKAKILLTSLLTKKQDTMISNPEQTALAQFYYECWLGQIVTSSPQAEECEHHFRLAVNNLLTRINSEKEFAHYADNIHPVYFVFDHATIEQGSMIKMQKLIAELRKVKTPMQVVLYGYTDRVGSEKYNMKLAQARIEVVKNILLNSGVISKDRITSKAYGKDDPTIDINSVVNNPPSRRVDIFLYKQE